MKILLFLSLNFLLVVSPYKSSIASFQIKKKRKRKSYHFEMAILSQILFTENKHLENKKKRGTYKKTQL